MGVGVGSGPEKARIKGILFDKDGTLIDFHATWLPILEEAALMTARGEAGRVPELMVSVGYDAGSGRVRSGSVIAAGDTRDLAEVWSVQAAGWHVEDLVIRLDALFTARGAANSAPVTDLVRLFAALRGRGFRLGIATNDTAASALATIERFGLAVHLDFHCGYDSGHGSKPAPGMVHAFCAAAGLSPSEVAVVGDNKHDVDMGRAGGAGLLVGVLTGTSSRAELEPHADAVIDSVADLPALLERLG
jgi:phosphoglycolate phosphatase